MTIDSPPCFGYCGQTAPATVRWTAVVLEAAEETSAHYSEEASGQQAGFLVEAGEIVMVRRLESPQGGRAADNPREADGSGLCSPYPADSTSGGQSRRQGDLEKPWRRGYLVLVVEVGLRGRGEGSTFWCLVEGPNAGWKCLTGWDDNQSLANRPGRVILSAKLRTYPVT